MGISVDTSGLELDKFISAANISKANTMLTEMVASDTDRFVPKDTSALRGHIELSEDEIVYTEEYADHVYNMGNANWTTPGTSGDWIEPSKKENMEKWEQFASDAILGEAR